MVHEADKRVQQRRGGDDGQDDFSELLINFIRTVRRKACGHSKKKDEVIKKSDLVFDILEGQKCLADEGKPPSATKSKEFLVYRRKRFRGAKNKGDGCNPTSSLKTYVEPETIQGTIVDNLGPARVIRVADIPASTQLVSAIPPEEHKQFGLNHGLHGIARKEHMLMRRERQKALVAFRRSGIGMRRQLMVPLRKPTTPLLTAMPPVTTQKLPPFGFYSQQPTIGIGSSHTPHLLPNGPLGGVTWTENELDALWLGVRRHGVGYWESIMKDPTLHFSRYKKPEHLFERWNVEKFRALGVEHIYEPRRHPERQLITEASPQASTHIERSSYRKDKFAAGYLKRQTLMLGGTFPLTDAIMNEFKGKGKAKAKGKGKEKEEASSEGTISD